MKKIITLFISLITTVTFAQTEEPFPYQKEWATAAHPFTRITAYFSDGASLLYGGNLNGAYDEFVPEDTEFKHYVLAKISTDQELAFTLPFGDNSTLLIPSLIAIDESDNFYLSGHTQQAVEIGTPGTHQPNFPGNMTLPDTLYFNENDFIIYPPRLCSSGYLIKYDSEGNKLWGTYFGGNQEEFLYWATAKNDEVVVVGQTFSNTGLATPGAYMEEPDEYLTYHNQSAFVAKFDSATGNLLWATYLPVSFGIIQHLTLNSLGEILIPRRTSIDGYAYSILKISTDGTTITEIPLEGAFSTQQAGFFGILLDDDDNLYVVGRTNSSENITTPGTYKTIKTNDSEGYIIKYDSSYNKLWATYMPVEWIEEAYHISNISVLPHTDNNNNTNIYVSGATSENDLATNEAYQETIAGETDIYMLKLNPEGQLNWFTYFGGPEQENTGGIFIDENDNLYLSGRSKSTSGVLTENPLFDYPPYPIWYPFIAKFTHVKNVSTPQQEYSFRLYPNPATEYIALESNYLFDSKTQLTVYDMQGKIVHKQAATHANTQVIETMNWAKGTYILLIENEQLKKEFKFGVR
ncbi:T9SS type A sorting domain-containing protein [Avrilella dinanensis]|uniref:T9SS type A sorting domain-containing protein n=1 Tax=Avrilella dinanensis TaxID=2008672 RepID=UPI0024094C56|nr:T9SS type A sorting domain-containing protein [Avrilella dinanensis]